MCGGHLASAEKSERLQLTCTTACYNNDLSFDIEEIGSLQTVRHSNDTR